MISALTYSALQVRAAQRRKSRTVAGTPVVDSSRAAKEDMGLRVALTKTVNG